MARQVFWMKRLILELAVLMCLSVSTFAQEAPPPHKAPRMTVNRESLLDRHAAQNRNLEGQALIIEGDKLRIGETDFRLFGVIPPQLSASFGPQARNVLDGLVSSQNVSCLVRDRDHEGHLLATCHNASGVDLALELLKRGLAVTARNSLADTNIASSYLAAEQAAILQKIGLWSVEVPPAAALVVKPSETASLMPTEEKKEDLHKEEPVKPEIKKEEIPQEEMHKDEIAKTDPAKKDILSQTISIPVTSSAMEENTSTPRPNASGFFARYQILLSSFLMLITALGVLISLAFQRRGERRDETKALAAALRGELSAARAVCYTRLKSIATDEDDQALIWPRLRSTLYQAYVGRIGNLGAELARKIASIYGQASDYAVYYSSDDQNSITTPKRRALQTLVGHIEEVLPRLEYIEHSGKIPTHSAASFTDRGAVALENHVPVAKNRLLPLSSKDVAHPSATASISPEASSVSDSVVVASVPQEKEVEVKSGVTTSLIAKEEFSRQTSLLVKPQQPENTSSTLSETNIDSTNTTEIQGRQSADNKSVDLSEKGRPHSSPVALWHTLRQFARDRFVNHFTTANDDLMPDYAALIEQDIANMSFNDGEAEFTLSDDMRQSGSR